MLGNRCLLSLHRPLRVIAPCIACWTVLPAIAIAQWSSSGSTVYYNGGNVCVGTATPSSSKFVVVTPDGGSVPQIAAEAGGTAQGQRADYSFFPTFQGTSDNAPRRAADIVSGFNGCPWGCEYLSFNVGSGGAPNDVGALTIERMRITSAGNVGIGTTAPLTSLQIGNTGSYAQDARITMATASGTGPFRSWSIGAKYGGAATNSPNYGFTIRDETARADRMVIDWATGNIGIGTENPQYPLSVNGTIQAKEVLVNTGWSDYVFDPDYKLMSLPRVAAYIKQHHHLPGIPSQAEVEKNGVSLGAMQSKLLAQVEKLTLQVIQLQEEIYTLQKNNLAGADKPDQR